MKEKILKIIKEIQPYEEINYDTLLICEGILDSLSMAELIVTIEDEFLIDIPEEMIIEENFQTIETIEIMIERVRLSYEDYRRDMGRT